MQECMLYKKKKIRLAFNFSCKNCLRQLNLGRENAIPICKMHGMYLNKIKYCMNMNSRSQ